MVNTVGKNMTPVKTAMGVTMTLQFRAGKRDDDSIEWFRIRCSLVAENILTTARQSTLLLTERWEQYSLDRRWTEVTKMNQCEIQWLWVDIYPSRQKYV